MKPGDTIAGQFLVELLAGSGGMGRVYRARDIRTGEAVALKVMLDARSVEGSRFVREAEVLAEVRHPGIVRYVAHGETLTGERYLAMEWIEGEDLAQHLRTHRLSVSEAVTLTRRLAEALGAAHRRGVVHRDLKPSNVRLVGESIEEPRILDFGIARLERASALTVAGRLLGTPGYMAPEQARGEREVDARADVFSLGCVLFELLTRRPPFQGEQVVAVLAKILIEEAPRLSEVLPGAPASLEKLVARLLAKAPDDRPRDGGEVARLLAELGPLDDALGPASQMPTSLTARERRLLAVILVERAPDAKDTLNAWKDTDSSAVTMSADSLENAPITRAMAIAASFGAQLSPLVGGVVVTLGGGRVATDLAAHAARCALALREVFESEPMVLVTGRAEIAYAVPVGEMLDRAASRLAVTPKGSIALDDVSARLLDVSFEVASSETGSFLLGANADSARQTLLGRATPCVGREREIARLIGIFDDTVEQPQAHVALVTGPAGAGKSRLAREVLQRLGARADVTIWKGRGDPMRAGSPFGLVAPFLRHAANLREGEPLSERRNKLRERVARHVPEADVARVTEFLGELIGTQFEASQSVQLAAARRDAMVMGDQLRRAFEDFLEAECTAHPVLIVLEDLHWGDLPTTTLIQGALRRLSDRPLMVLALARPELEDHFPRLWSALNREVLQLAPLTRKAGERLVKNALGDAVAPALIERLWQRSAGNAFYLEELIRVIAEGKSEAMPETVLAMVQTRLEALEPEARRVLRAASVFGEVFFRAGLARLLGDESSTALDAVLASLEQRELILRHPESRFPGDVELGFRHALVREAAYAALTEADRTLGHRLAFAFLEQAGEGDAMLLASHAELGDEAPRAARWYLRASEVALEGNDIESAIARAERGLSCLRRENVERDDDLEGRLLLVQAEANRWVGRSKEGERLAFAAMRLLPRASTAWCRAAGDAGLMAGRLSRPAELGRVCDELEAVWRARHVADGPLVIAIARSMISLMLVGQHDRAEGLHALLTDDVLALIAHDASALGWFQRAQGHHALHRGDSAAYLAMMQASTVSFTRAGDLRTALAQRVNEGFAYVQLGRYDVAATLLRAVLVESTTLGARMILNGARNNLGIALAHLGQLEEARALEELAAGELLADGDRRLAAGSLVYLATIHRLAGALDLAERAARDALEPLVMRNSARVEALATLAEVLLAARRTDEALAFALEAMEIQASLGDRLESNAIAPLVCAEALDACGRREDALRVLLPARDRLLLRASKISSPALRASMLENVPSHARTLQLARDWSAV